MIVGSGAREHAISCAYEKSEKVEKIIVTPGNDFIGFNREKDVIIDKNCKLDNPESILEIAKKYKPDLIDVAQEDALAAGTVDLLKENGFRVFGPVKAAARIEWDKKWSREFMDKQDIPRPDFKYFQDLGEAKKYVFSLYEKDPNKLLYIKAVGLCAGKGALKTESYVEAVSNIEKMKEFKDAGKVFLIEEGLSGEEFSYYAISDGENYKLLRSAQDNKTVFNFDSGGQTGGMGVVAPAKVTESISGEIESELIGKAIGGMKSESPYVGILYLGGMVVGGKPVNIEYNSRWGDPECQTVLPGIESDYLDLVMACLDKRLNEVEIKQDNKVRICVVGASRGYPGDYSIVKGKRIYDLLEAMKVEGVKIYGAGISVRNGNFYAKGGRLFSVVGWGENILDASRKAYTAMALISIEGNNLHYRTDIGWRDLERFRKDL